MKIATFSYVFANRSVNLHQTIHRDSSFCVQDVDNLPVNSGSESNISVSSAVPLKSGENSSFLGSEAGFDWKVITIFIPRRVSFIYQWSFGDDHFCAGQHV